MFAAIMRSLLIVLALVACQRTEKQPEDKLHPGPPKPVVVPAPGSNAGSSKWPGSAAAPTDLPKVPHVEPMIDIKTPPPDAQKTSSGLIYKKILENPLYLVV